MIYAPGNSPDSKYGMNNEKPTVKISYRKPEVGVNRRDSGTKQHELIPEPKPLRYINKHNSLYNSWEVGLHNYHIHDDNDNDYEEPLTFRFKLRQHDVEQKRIKKAPPKDPFKDAILTDLDSRRNFKVKEAVTFRSTDDLITGKPIVEDPPSYLDLLEMQRGSQGFHRIRQLNLPEEYTKSKDEAKPVLFLDGSDKGSSLFQKKNDIQKVKRPFDESTNQNPRLLTGKTVLRNPLSPVPLKHRYNPVVVMRSKLDDYTGAIQHFLEQVVEEQRLAAFEKQPLPLSQTVENMVIYQDFDTIQYFKTMKKKLKQSQQQTHDLQRCKAINFKAPANNVAKGVARVQKLGAIMSSGEPLEPLPKSGIKPQVVYGQSVFLTNPLAGAEMTPEHSTLQRLMLMSAGMRTPTSAPPNTPHVSKLC